MSGSNYNENDYLEDDYLNEPPTEEDEETMADRSKIIFVNTDGDFEETSASDSLNFASYKTANYELTDALLGDVTNLMIKSDGSRDFAADQSMGGFKLTSLAAGVSDSDAINLGQLKGMVNGLAHKQPVRVAVDSNVADLAEPGAALDGVTLAQGDRVLLAGQTDASENGIYVFDTDATPLVRSADLDSDAELVDGIVVSIKEGSYASSRFLLTSNDPMVIGTDDQVWEEFPFTAIEAGDGIDIVGDTVSVDLASGGGLKIVSTELAIEPSDFAGEGLVDDGSDNLAIDWSTSFDDSKAVKASDLSSNANGLGASIIGLEDAAEYTSAANVEEAIAELYSLSGSKLYTVGTGGVTKGDLVYLSANDEVTKMPINAMHRAIGLALATVSAAGEVAVQGFDYVIPGAIAGATAGDRYYWSGSALSTTMPAGGGSYVWQAGIAANATDLVAALEFIKKNS